MRKESPELEREHKNWEKRVASNGRQRQVKFTTISGEDVKMLYTPEDLRSLDFLEEIGYPGEYPFTRGIHA